MSLKLRAALFTLALGALFGCGGGGGGGSVMPGPPAPPPPPQPAGAAAIHANQHGFQPAADKRAIVVADAQGPFTWRLMSAQNAELASGQTQRFGVNAGSGQIVHIADFSNYATPGVGMRIEASAAQSHPFDIAADIYEDVKYGALAFFYHQRSGVAIEAQFVGAAWARPIAHNPDAGGCRATDFRGNNWGGCPYASLDVTRGWYDAGDHGKYVVNGGIAVWTLMNYFERIRARPAARVQFADGALQIPERANGVDDLLDEVRWQMDFLLAMQVPDGTQLTLPLGSQSGNLNSLNFTAVDASGMAHHKFHDVNWTGIPTPPHLDTQQRFLSYPSTAATLNLAATAAQCSRAFRGLDDAYADQCLAAARRAYAAAKRVPNAFAIDITQGGGGGYGDSNVSDEFYWAAAELFAATGEAEFNTDMRASPHFLASVGDFAWPFTAALGTITLAMAPSTLPAGDVSAARARIVATAGTWLGQMADEGYAIPFSRSYVWGSNGDMSNRALLLGLAYDFTADARYRNGVVAVLDYLLGRNPLDQSYVAGFGERPMAQPHHRFWVRVLDAALPPPPAGALAGGSNFANPGQDEVAVQIRAGCFAQTCYRDDWRAFSLNEVAINWNAPLFWIAAFADEP